jgi:hypothetical protein
MKALLLLFAMGWLGVQTPVGKYTEIAGLPAPPVYTVKAIKETLTMDGDLSEPAWQRAASLTLMFPWDSQTGAKQRTTVKLLRDQTHLYVAYECEDADLTAQLTQRDDKVYLDDCVEIFLKPSEKTDSYVGLEMNARGVLFDYFYDFPQKFDPAFNLDNVQVKAKLRGTLNESSDKDQGWTLEVAIPWQSLKALALNAPARNEEWRVQINRWDGTDPARRLSMWCHSGLKRAHPHNPERFGTLRFN